MDRLGDGARAEGATDPMRARGDHGSIAVELAVIAPVVALLFGAVIYAGRLSTIRDDVAAATQLASRAASRERTPGAASDAATQAAVASLPVGTPSCRTVAVSSPLYAGSQVQVTVTCSVDLSAASMVPLPGHVSVSETWTEPLD